MKRSICHKCVREHWAGHEEYSNFINDNPVHGWSYWWDSGVLYGCKYQKKTGEPVAIASALDYVDDGCPQIKDARSASYCHICGGEINNMAFQAHSEEPHERHGYRFCSCECYILYLEQLIDARFQGEE
jgi:hypothetical protein